ncbi:MAG: Ltp family lipoprotein [Oscillibacter sp.]|nr:Ltp family lipoprotein [Oscillibacter sp.]
MKNPMKACSACGVEIAKSAKACPHCGAKNKKPIYKKWWFWLIIIFILIGALGSSSDEPEHPEEDASAVVSDIIPETADTEEKSTVDEIKNSEIFIDNEIKEKQTEVETNPDDSAGLSISQINALASAKSYLSFSAFSYSGLIDQLEFEGFTPEQATYGADNCGADWNEQAAKSAKSYLEFSSFSRDGLIDQLEFEGFTHEQAVYGVEANGF